MQFSLKRFSTFEILIKESEKCFFEYTMGITVIMAWYKFPTFHINIYILIMALHHTKLFSPEILLCIYTHYSKLQSKLAFLKSHLKFSFANSLRKLLPRLKGWWQGKERNERNWHMLFIDGSCIAIEYLQRGKT